MEQKPWLTYSFYAFYSNVPDTVQFAQTCNCGRISLLFVFVRCYCTVTFIHLISIIFIWFLSIFQVCSFFHFYPAQLWWTEWKQRKKNDILQPIAVLCSKTIQQKFTIISGALHQNTTKQWRIIIKSKSKSVQNEENNEHFAYDGNFPSNFCVFYSATRGFYR